MVQLTAISKSFTDDAGHLNALINNLTIDFKAGEFTVIIGANGSGKSTLLNLIAGLVLPDAGSITIDNVAVQNLKTFERSTYIARVFQNPLQGTVAELTVMENMRLAYLRNSSKGLRLGINSAFIDKVKTAIAQLNLGLENKTEQKMGTLSGGQRQALTLVMATLCDAKVLLMDEPSAALDPKSAHSLLENAAKIIATNNLTTLLVTHNMQKAASYGNRLIMMKEGNIARDIGAKEKAFVTPEKLFEWMS